MVAHRTGPSFLPSRQHASSPEMRDTRRAAAALLQLLLMYIPRVPLCSAPESAPLLPRHIASMPAHPCAHLLRCLPVCARFCAFHPSTSTPTPFDFFFRHPLSPQRGAVQAWLMVLLHSEFTPLSSPTIISTIILSYVAFILTSTHPLLQPRTLLPPNLNIITLLNPPIFARQNALGPVQLPPLVPELSPLLPFMTSLLTCQTPSPPLFTLFCQPFGLSYFTNTFFTAFYTLPHLNINQKSAP